MISLSHWGMFECTGNERANPQLFVNAIEAGFISYYDSKYLHG